MSITYVNSVDAQQIVAVGDASGTVVNRDIARTIFWGNSHAAAIGPNASILDPLVGIPVDGSQNIWCVAPPGTQGNIAVDYILGANDWSPGPTQVAASIAAGGTFLGGNDVILTDRTALNGTAWTINAGVGQTVYNGPITGTSWVVSFAALSNNPPPTIPFVKVSFLWKTAAGATVLPIQHWFGLITNVSPAASNTQMAGKGPSDSSFLQIIVKNLDTNPITLDFTLVQGSRSVPPRDDIRSNSNNISNTYTWVTPNITLTFSTPVSDCTNNMIGYGAGISLLQAGTPIQRINGLYAGEAQLCITPDVNVKVQIDLWAPDPEFAIPLAPIYSNLVTISNSFFLTDVTLTRTPSILFIQNVDVVDAHITYTLVPKEFAS